MTTFIGAPRWSFGFPRLAPLRLLLLLRRGVGKPDVNRFGLRWTTLPPAASLATDLCPGARFRILLASTQHDHG
jgi:hypothetical protein